MFFRKITLFVLCLLSLSTLAQSKKQRYLDSIEAAIPNTKVDTAKVLQYNRLAYYYQNIDREKGIAFAQKALALAKKTNNSESISESYQMLAVNHEAASTDKALELFKIALSHAKRKKTLVNCYLGMGLIYTHKSDYKNAMKYLLMALQIAEEIKDDKLSKTITLNIGIIYYEMNDLPKALEYYTKSLEASERMGDKSGMAYSYGNIGNVYSTMKQTDKAIGYYEKAAKMSIELNDVMSESMSYGAIGEIYFQEKKFDKAIAYLEHSIKISRKINDVRNVAYVTAVLGDTQLEMAKLPQYKNQKKELLHKAIANFNESSDIQKGQQTFKEIYTNYEQLAVAYGLLGNYQKAFDLSTLSIQYKDSIYNEDTKETVKNLEDKRSIELRDKQIQLNKATLKNKEKEQWLYITGIAFLLIIAGLIFRQSRNRKKNNEKLQQLNKELDTANKVKARFFSILNHDLRSPVSSLVNFLHLQKESPDLLDEESKQRMENKTISSAENLLDSMEDLLLWSKGQMENFEPQPRTIFVSSVFTDLEKHFSSVENVRIIFENPDDVRIYTDEHYLKTILRNLTGNAIKALEKTPHATVVLNAFQSEGKIKIAVADNGPGGTMEKFRALYDENEVVGIKTGLGLHLIRDLAKAIDCAISVDTQQQSGTVFTLSFQ